MLGFWLNILEQGLIFGIMVIGVYLSYRVLDFPDLSVDGSFPLGAAVTATALVSGTNPIIACVLSIIAGVMAGSITGLLHVKFKITNLMSGILVMIGLYSINLRIMGKANVPLFNNETIFTGGLKPIIYLLIVALLSKLLIDFFLNTKLGFLLKATGDNHQLVTSLGVNKDNMKILGLGISNGLVALSGSIMAQHQKFSDVGMGSGIIVMGLASIIIGETIFKKISLLKATTISLLGSILYKACIGLTLKMGFPPTDLKLITSVIVIAALALNKKELNLNIRKPVFLGGKIYVTDKKSV